MQIRGHNEVSVTIVKVDSYNAIRVGQMSSYQIRQGQTLGDLLSLIADKEEAWTEDELREFCFLVNSRPAADFNKQLQDGDGVAIIVID